MLFIMKRDDSMVCGWRLCGTAQTQKSAENIRKAHTTFANGKPFRVPQIWEQREYDEWQAQEVKS